MLPACCFFFNDTATTEIYTLSLHDALPICADPRRARALRVGGRPPRGLGLHAVARHRGGARRARSRAPDRGRLRLRRSEEHTSELQSRQYLVCRLLLEKKKSEGCVIGEHLA